MRLSEFLRRYEHLSALSDTEALRSSVMEGAMETFFKYVNIYIYTQKIRV